MLLIRNARPLSPWKGDGRLEGGDVLVDAGAIQSPRARNLSAPGAKVIDAARPGYVMPGIVDAHCHIGMWEDGMDDTRARTATKHRIPSTPAAAGAGRGQPRRPLLYRGLVKAA